MSIGMAENPGESYALSDRFVCGTCGETPRILNGREITGGGPYTIKLKCHGEHETITVDRQELTHIQHVFKKEGEES